MPSDPGAARKTGWQSKQARMSSQSKIKSVEVTARILRVLGASLQAIPLRDIARSALVTPSQAHKYLVSLCETGLARQSGDDGSYALGPAAVQIGVAALAALDVEGAGRRAVEALMRRTGMTTALCGWNDRGPLVLSVSSPPDAIFAGLRLGARLPAENSATGHVFLAFTSEGPPAPPALGTILAAVRREGVAQVEDAVMVGMSGAAAPVFDHSGRILFTLTLVAPTLAGNVGAAVPKLMGAAKDLSRELGAPQA